ncbi:MAG: hypothetical protein EOM67_04665 [Spirochaetia bacterium]|nr:hypothetical protein [Spirochaetia bacterium]
MRHHKLKKWEKHEESILEGKNGLRVPGSGACPGLKGDVRVDTKHNYLSECKQTEGSGFRVTEKLWNKIKKEAIEIKRLPIMCLDINGTRLVVCDEELFWELNEEQNVEKS